MSGETVELRRIENRTDRKKAFLARIDDLFKKAYELSVLCDAEVALIVFSDRGRLYEFGRAATIKQTLERYQLCTTNIGTKKHQLGEINNELKVMESEPNLQIRDRQVPPPEAAKETNTYK